MSEKKKSNLDGHRGGKPRNVQPTAQQMALIKILEAQIDKPNKEFTWGKALEQAGYSPSVCRAPSNVYRAKAFREYVPQLVQSTAEIADMAGTELKRRMSPGNIEMEKTDDIRKVMGDSIKFGRLMNDESTSNTKTTKEDMQSLSDEELREMAFADIQEAEVVKDESKA